MLENTAVFAVKRSRHTGFVEDIRTAGGGGCLLVNIIIQKEGKEVSVCEVVRVAGQLSDRSNLILCKCDHMKPGQLSFLHLLPT